MSKTPFGPQMRAIVVVLAAATALVVAIGPVAAASPQPVTISSVMTFHDTGPSTGTFDATGSSLICAQGTVVDIGLIFSGARSGHGYQVLVRKLFTCSDGSGTIFVKLQVQGNNDGTESFEWVIQGGTGAYASLTGSGRGSSVPVGDPESGIVNTYVGFLIG